MGPSRFLDADAVECCCVEEVALKGDFGAMNVEPTWVDDEQQGCSLRIKPMLKYIPGFPKKGIHGVKQMIFLMFVSLDKRKFNSFDFYFNF